MNINKLNFESISDLSKVLKIDKNKLKYISPQEFEKIINNVKIIVTIHLYPFSHKIRKEKCLLDLHRWSYHQIYLFIYKNNIHWSFGHGDTSGSRTNHNHLLSIFLKNKSARRKVITAIIVTFDGNIISYYFYDYFSYCNNDIGSNWDRNIIKILKKSKLPYSEINYENNLATKTISFVNKGTRIEIFRQTGEDLFSRNFLQKLVRTNRNK